MGAGGAAPEPFGALLRRRRLAAGLTQEGLAERAGLSARGVSDLERGARRAPQRETVRRLARGLGLRPAGAAALEAAAARLPGRASGAAAMPCGQRAPAAVIHNLPLQLTSFVGRERELGEVAALLGAHRLVTLTGPGGTGKTRLALQAAADALGGHAHGVWLAELAPLADPDLVPQAVAQALGVREEPGRPLLATLTDALRPRRLLLLLDNCEHLLDAGARLADALLRACPQVRLLATSREPLRIAGEVVWRLSSLALPDARQPPTAATLIQSEAVRLFVDRAEAALPAFAVTDQNASAVAQVCARLDGIPLALELAAARVPVLPVEQLLGRLDDRFRLLTGGSRTALERHQTLRAAVDWSHDLLTEPERALFRRLAVFAGGWSLAAAERVAADPAATADAAAAGQGGPISAGGVLDLLSRLVERSLVLAEEDAEGQARFRLLETLREYARGRLEASGEAAAVRRRHLACYTALAEAAEPELEGAAQRVWLARLEREHDNCRAALRWAVDHPAPDAVEQGLRLAGALPWFWVTRGHFREARAWLDALLDAPAAAPPSVARAKALAWAGATANFLGDAAAARARRDACAALVRELGHSRALAGALQMFGHALAHSGDPAEAAAWLAQSEAFFRQAGDGPGLAFTLYELGRLARREGDYEAARRAFEGSAALYQRAGNRNRAAGALHSLGATLRAAGDAAASRPLHEEALAVWRELGYQNGVAGALNSLGEVAAATGAPARARALFEEGLACSRAVGNRQSEALVLRNLALLARAAGDPAAARRGLLEAVAIWRAAGREEHIAETLEQLAGLALGDGAAAALGQGRGMTPEHAIAAVFPDGDRPHSAPTGAPVVPAVSPAADTDATPGEAPLRVDPETYTVWRGPQPLPRRLAAREFALVRHLHERAGRVCSRQELGDAVWGPGRWDSDMLYRLVRRVREKLEPHPERPRHLHNFPGFGYRLLP